MLWPRASDQTFGEISDSNRRLSDETSIEAELGWEEPPVGWISVSGDEARDVIANDIRISVQCGGR